eukprot:779288-Prorocentrum_minimum.AAC.1
MGATRLGQVPHSEAGQGGHGARLPRVGVDPKGAQPREPQGGRQPAPRGVDPPHAGLLRMAPAGQRRRHAPPGEAGGGRGALRRPQPAVRR